MDVEQSHGSGAEPSTALRALSRLATRHGLVLSAQQLRRAYPFEGEEPVPALLKRIARGSGFKVRRLRVRPGELGRLAPVVPALLLLANGKAALLTQVQTSGGTPCALLEDLEATPGTEVLLDEPRLFQIWGGDTLLLKRQLRLTDQDRPFEFSWLLGQVLREGRLFRDIGIAGVIMSVLSLAPPMLAMILIDRVLYNHSMATLQVLSLLMLAIIAFETVFSWVRKRLTAIATTRIDARINLHTFDKMLNLPLAYFEHNSTGFIAGKLGQVWHIRRFLVDVVAGTLLDAVTLLILLPVLFILNATLTWMVLFVAVLIGLIYVVALPSLRVRHMRVIEAETRMGSHQVETIFGIKTVKSLSLDGMKRRERDQLVAESADAHLDYEFRQNWPQTLVMPLERLIYSGTFMLGTYMALQSGSTTSIGSVVAFAILSGRITAPIVQLAGLINDYEYANGAMGTVASVLNNPPEEGRGGTGLRQPITGRVVFQDVRFRYSPTAAYAIDSASFEIPRGTIFGVMGRSGSGKTTVTRLLQGLSRDYEGLIKIDGMDLREIDLDHLRANIGVVPQENFLFRSTIRENIAAARPTLGFDKVVRAAQLAGAEEFIERLPNGYATAVEEGAVNFSGGQRQRLAIARALLVDPPILVLDEATSALDAESEAIVSANLLRIAKGRTVIIISHRLSSLMMADNILVMERGRVHDIGRHEELVERCDIYKTLWYQQNRHLDHEGKYTNA